MGVERIGTGLPGALAGKDHAADAVAERTVAIIRQRPGGPGGHGEDLPMGVLADGEKRRWMFSAPRS